MHFVRGEHGRARELAAELINVAERLGDDDLRLEGSVAKGYADLWGGNLAGALAHFDRVRETYDFDRHRGHAIQYGRDPLASALTHMALALWLSGQSEPALETMHEALRLAHRLSHPVSLAWALCFLSLLHLLREEPQHARQRAEELVALASGRQRLAFWSAWGSFLTHWSRAAMGEWAEGAEGMAHGLEECRVIGANIALPYFEGLRAYAAALGGDGRTGEDDLNRAVAAAERQGERWYQPELYRMRGDLLLRAGEPDMARGCFEQALVIARSQGAKALEDRALGGLGLGSSSSSRATPSRR